MHEIGETWRGRQDGIVWRVAGYNSLACTYMLETEGDARMLVTENWFDSAIRLPHKTFARWWHLPPPSVARGP